MGVPACHAAELSCYAAQRGRRTAEPRPTVGSFSRRGKRMRILIKGLSALAAVSVVGCSQDAADELDTVDMEASGASVVESVDGTHIGYAEVGNGPVPLVIVHGVLDTADSWVPVAEALSELCSCYVMDRRGRGRSEDREEYSFEREIEDIEAVLRAVGPDAFLLGHSSGAIYTLEAARRAPIAGLILYEPPLHYEGFEVAVDEIRGRVAEGRLDDAAAVFFGGEGGLSERELNELRDAPVWPQIAELAPTLVREWDAIFTFNPTVERYRELSMPTLLLSGTESMNNPTFATAGLEQSLRDVRTTALEGQGYTANEAAPELVASSVADFLREVVE